MFEINLRIFIKQSPNQMPNLYAYFLRLSTVIFQIDDDWSIFRPLLADILFCVGFLSKKSVIYKKDACR